MKLINFAHLMLGFWFADTAYRYGQHRTLVLPIAVCVICLIYILYCEWKGCEHVV